MIAPFLTDGYKLDHRRMYPEGTERVYWTWIPRSNKHFANADKVVVFGNQYVLLEINKYWRFGFFDKDFKNIKTSWERRLSTFLGPNEVGYLHLEELHKLGYLPIEVLALPEGSVTKPGIPHVVCQNTDDRFAWLPNYIETLYSLLAWTPSTSATISRIALKNIHEHAEFTNWNSEQKDTIPFLVHDFSMRGMRGIDSTVSSGMGHMTSFVGTEVIPAIEGCENYYFANAEKEVLATTVPASEHSVMCAGGEENELETYRRLLKLYPTGFVSIVSDTWDYWYVLLNILPKLKDEILARDGRLVIRPDSGDPVDIVCGVAADIYVKDINDKEESIAEQILDIVKDETPHGQCGCNEKTVIVYESITNLYYEASITNISWNRYDKQFYFIDMWEKPKLDIEICKDQHIYKGSYELLWDLFGGIYQNGYKVLDNHIGMIYGDAITLDRQKKIYEKLEEKGFMATNLVLGLGSYTFNGTTRDSLGWAIKTSSIKINGEWKEVFKDPKTVVGMPKKSLKGLCIVKKDENNEYYVEDQIDPNTYFNDDGSFHKKCGEMDLVYRNGNFIKYETFSEIRNRVKQSI